jgi:nucleotide-binding universal stress UspA family protein
MSTIVVGYDGTAGADRALDEAATLARSLGDTLVLVFAYEATRAGGEVADLDAAIAERGRTVLEQGRARCGASGLELDLRQLEESPVDGLLDTAEAVDARMIVVGSYGEHPLKGALLGSTPYRLVHLSTRPVLVVRAPDA